MAGFFLFRGLRPQCVPRRFEGKDALLAELAQLGTFRQQCNMLKAMSFERQELSASCQFFLQSMESAFLSGYLDPTTNEDWWYRLRGHEEQVLFEAEFDFSS